MSYELTAVINYMQQRMQKIKIDFKVLLIFILALIVRLLGISTRPIWYDEAFSILFSEKGIAPMLYGTLAATGSGTADIHPLSYYTLLWLWMKAFGESLVAVRILSIIAGMGIVYLIYLIGRELFGETTAQLAMLFTALAPFQIHYAQEIRMYSFMAMWVLLANYAYLRGSKIWSTPLVDFICYRGRVGAIHTQPCGFLSNSPRNHADSPA